MPKEAYEPVDGRREEDGASLARRAHFPGSLCHGCAEHRYVEGRATVFIRCNALGVKYPPQPVLRCPAFRRASP